MIKGNRPELLQAIVDWIGLPTARPPEVVSRTKGHGRLVVGAQRRCALTVDLGLWGVERLLSRAVWLARRPMVWQD